MCKCLRDKEEEADFLVSYEDLRLRVLLLEVFRDILPLDRATRLAYIIQMSEYTSARRGLEVDTCIILGVRLVVEHLDDFEYLQARILDARDDCF